MLLVYDGKVGKKMASCGSILRGDEVFSLKGSLELIDLAETSAKEIVKNATDQAKQIVEEAKAEAKKITNGAKEALEEEKKKGHEEGLNTGKQEVAERILEIARKSMEEFVGLKETLIHIVMRSIKRIIGEMDAKELLERIVSSALVPLQNQHSITLRVHPDQAAFVKEKMAEQPKVKSGEMIIHVIADGKLEKDACILLTDVDIIDASLNVQLTAIENVMHRAIK
ncbi:MAG: type III secretion system stator protein SctL [Puniceicoccales bacterium]|jgi:type III secretion protein L|nr:type III secretion system stator protein SctL [Puniceicoccales bacterium]